ncbi:MAG: D-xylose ABC transporter ATP-binding protein [Ignavibacteria bacterium RBG_13_36_8]|nr:MAG: D-xylose ABC transporter ATP-binding protein [Ignavibacteria bacterium RBG_13_36_8]
MKNDIILKMEGIGKTFPGVTALDDVGFELRKGEVHVLLGENGAGKSTLVKILSGAIQKTSGRISLFGDDTIIKSPRHALALGISIIYQELNLIPYLSAAENIFLGREITNKIGLIDKRAISKAAQNIMDDLCVEIDVGLPVKNLGIAKQQMIEIAKALSFNAKILIMDEPTSALTETEIKQLFSTIRRLKEKGVSIIYISHRLEELFEIGDRVTVLRDGKKIGTRNIAETNKNELILLMVNREVKEQFPKQKAQIGDEILRVEGLTRKGTLKNINFSLHQGEILGISGLLGSGRTELARALFGADKIDSGKIFIKGVIQKIDSPRDAINIGIGFLTEDRKSQGLILVLSLKENISMPSLNRFSKFGIVNSKLEEEATKSFVDKLQIKTPGINQKVIYLSGGNQQKVVLAKWLCRNADILIFDEPTRGIDVGSKVEIYQLMNQLTAAGVAVIMISSELPEILGMSDRILVMHQNEIATEFTVEEATQEKIMQYALGA